MDLERAREDLLIKQKKGLPFILASCVIWALITVVSALDLPVMTRNLLVFCCACPLFPLAMLAGKLVKVNILEKGNPLVKPLVLFTMNQLIYLLIVLWVYYAVPDKMIMVFAMVFGAHLLPYSWIYKCPAYLVFAIVIPVIALVTGLYLGGLAVAAIVEVIEILFAFILYQDAAAVLNGGEGRK